MESDPKKIKMSKFEGETMGRRILNLTFLLWNDISLIIID